MEAASTTRSEAGRAEQRSIRAIRQGFALLRAIETHGEAMPISTLAAAAGMSAGQAHAYLAAFREVGLIRQEPGGDRYELGPYALTLGLAALARLDVREASLPPMRRLRDATGEAVHLALWSGSSPVIVARLDGHRALPVSIRIGFALPLDSSASGRVFLAFLPEARRLAEAALAGADTTPLARLAAETRRRRLARTDSLVANGFAALSASVFDHEGGLAAAMTVLGPAGVLDARLDGPLARALSEAASEASETLGHRMTTAGR
jgi:DNA-binding IclR family transcriptional regulator